MGQAGPAGRKPLHATSLQGEEPRRPTDAGDAGVHKGVHEEDRVPRLLAPEARRDYVGVICTASFCQRRFCRTSHPVGCWLQQLCVCVEAWCDTFEHLSSALRCPPPHSRVRLPPAVFVYSAGGLGDWHSRCATGVGLLLSIAPPSYSHSFSGYSVVPLRGAAIMDQLWRRGVKK